jgi:hypothetical protein
MVAPTAKLNLNLIAIYTSIPIVAKTDSLGCVSPQSAAHFRPYDGSRVNHKFIFGKFLADDP